VPEGRDDFKPHAADAARRPRAGLVAMMPSWLTAIVEQGRALDAAPPHPSQWARELKTQ
jgi:hypothetical protein